MHKPGFATAAIHAAEKRDPATNAHNTPIYQTATFTFETAEQLIDAIANPLDNFFYSRTGNPTTSVLEQKLAILEGAEEALVTSSGMAAVSIATMICARAGDHVLVDADLFVISREFFSKDCAAMGIAVDFVDVRDPAGLAAAIKPNTRALFAESVTNPNMRVADVPALRALCDARKLTLIIDNTFLGPYLFRPIEHGADIVVHSATKYLSGHGDTVAGVIAGKREAMRTARYKLDSFGQCASPFNAWLLLRGVRTLPLRMRQHGANALALARHLESHERVEWVRYPGLPSHPEHAAAARLHDKGSGGMFAFKLHGGLAEMNRFCNALELCDLGVSLGDVYTLVYPRPKNGNLMRVSVGCEDIEDVIADFDQALRA
jgi:methionine-gamma-lyase